MRLGTVVILAMVSLTSCAPALQGEGEFSGRPAYWEVPAYKKIATKGPKNAKGIVFWSHGVSGRRVQWKSPPARFMRKFALAGWDVVKINRNNLYENGWLQSGEDHISHLVKLARKAKLDGYRHIIAAGQSYGGAISLEASAEPDLFYGVIATAPGHGSDACGRGSGPFRKADTLTGQLVEAIERTKTPRILLTMAKGDECMEFNEPTDDLRKALLGSKSRFIFLDDTMPIHGHFAAQRRQFDLWYGYCVLGFFNPETEPAPGEKVCKPPSPLPNYLLPMDFQPPSPPKGSLSPIGSWSGTYDLGSGSHSDTRNLCVIIRTDLGTGLVTKMAYGAGKRLKLNMGTHDRIFKKEDAIYVYLGKKQTRIVLMPNPSYSEIALRHRSSSGKTVWTTTLRRGCKINR